MVTLKNIPWGLFLIRVGISGVLLWFGTQQLLDNATWIGYVPDWVVSLNILSAGAIVLLNGSAEILCGILLLLGVFTRFVALLMGIHLVLIAASLGNNATAVRDWGLAFAALGLALTGGGALSLEYSKRFTTRAVV